MASRRAGHLLCVMPEPFGTSEPFSPCSKRQQGEVFFAAAQALADGPSAWKNRVSLSCRDAASEAVQKVQLWVQLLSENTLASPWFCLKG